jgi:hypothetical protein
MLLEVDLSRSLIGLLSRPFQFGPNLRSELKRGTKHGVPWCSRVASSGVLFGRLSFSLMVLDPGLDPGLGEPIEFV